MINIYRQLLGILTKIVGNYQSHTRWCMLFRKLYNAYLRDKFTSIYFFFGKLTYVLKEEDTNIIRGIPQIYNDNRNIKQQMATG